MLKNNMQKNIEDLLRNENCLSPLNVVVQLSKELISPATHERNGSDIHDDVKDLFLKQANDGQRSIAYDTECQQFSHLSEETVCDLVSFIFNRRFGWSENSFVQNKKNQPLSKDEVAKEKEEEALLDRLIYCLSSENIQKALIQALTSCIRNAKDKPVVRSQSSIHLMEWYKFQLIQHKDVEAFRFHYEDIKSSLLVIIQDVWSAIRNACISRLGPLIHYFTLEQLKDFFSLLIEICNSTTASWQSVEGAVMGLHVIIKKLHWMDDSKSGDRNAEPQYSLKFGKQELECMPSFVSKEIHQTVFNLLSHPQLTVREHAIKVFSAYISRCDLQDAVTSFKNVIEGLCAGVDLDKYPLPHNAVSDSGFHFMDAYRAEGLLGVCLCLVKHIPPSEILASRPLYFSTFSLYLMHPASTVRQATSNVFKLMVIKDCSNPDTLRFVLQSLCCDWVPDMDVLLSSTGTLSQPRHSVTTIAKSDASPSVCWEWREGRLLAYELIIQFLIKNYWLYTFGSLHLSDSLESPREKGSSPHDHQDVHASVSNPLIQKHQKEALSENEEGGNSRRSRTHSFTSRTKPLQIAKVREDHKQQMSNSFGASDIGKSIGQRLTTISGYHDITTHTTGKHFSYYKSPEKGGTFQPSDITSLLMACHTLQNNKTKLTSPRTVDRQTSQISNPCETYITNRCRFTCEAEEDSLEDFSTLLERIFYQTVECLADRQWELRRMGQQLLGCVVEVMRWYDMTILEDLWDNQLKSETTVLSYGVCQALKYSVAHAARLHHLLTSPPPSWQDVQLCEHIILQILDPIRLKVGVWSQSVYMVLQERTDYDKFTVVAMETLMLVQSHFDLLTGQKYAQLNRMVSVIKELFTKSHPDSELCRTLRHSRCHKTFSTPSEGFLCCCIRQESDEMKQARQVEKYLLTELGHTLSHFLKVADVQTTHLLLPVFCRHLAFYIEDDKLCRHLIDCVMFLSSLILQKKKTHQRDVALWRELEQSVLTATQQLHTLLANSSLDEHTFKQLCDVYAVVCSPLPSNSYLPSLVQTLAPRITLEKLSNHSATTKPSRDVVVQHTPLAPIMDREQQSSDDDEDQIDASLEHMSESQTLNSSVNSTGSTKGFHQVHDEESAGSDWDSWDDDELQNEDLTDAIRELFQKLQRIVNNNNKASGTLFIDSVKGLASKEKHIVCSLLHLQL